MTTRRATRAATLATLLLLATQAAARPPTLAYEGTLENAAGEPVTCSDASNCPEGLLSFTFRLYRDDVEATPLWTETHERVPVVRGVFRVELGSVAALDDATVGAARTVGVAVNDGDALSPRQRLVAVPFAAVAGRAERTAQADRADVSGRADDAAALGGIPAGDFATVDDVLDLCLTPEALAASLLAGGYVTESALPGLLAGLGVATGPGFSGRFAELTGVPDGLGNGDDDTLAALACTDGEVAVYHSLDGAWQCELPSSGLSEAEVDAFVANNGFAQVSALAAIAKSGRFADLSGVPAALADGDDDTLAALTVTCLDGQVAKRFGTVWVCDDDATLSEADVDAMVANNGFARATDLASVATTGSFGSLANVPSGLSDGDNDALGALTCADGQVAKRQGSAWVCGNDVDTRLTEAEVDAFVANNGFAAASSLATVATSGRFSDLAGIPSGVLNGDDDALGALSCADGQVPRREGATWVCGADVDTLGGLSCATGQVAKRQSGVWVCAGDADSLGALACADGQIAKRQGNAWVCGTDVDTRLTEPEVDAFADDNGYALEAGLAAVATSGSFVDLLDVPAALADGDADTLGGLSCTTGQVPKRQGTAWVCGNDVDTRVTEAEVDAFVANNGFASAASLAAVAATGRFSDLVEVPTGIADGDNDTLGSLNCSDGQVAKRQGSTWACGNDVDTNLTEADVDAFVANNGFASSASLAEVATSGRFDDLSGVPTGVADGDNDTLGALSCAPGDVPRRTTTGWECSAQSASTQNKEIFHTHCAWTGGADEILSCTPQSCPIDTVDLGITGNFKTGVAKSGSTYHQGCGYTERTCLIVAQVVLTTTCPWTGAVGDISSCAPPPCPSGMTDLGITGNIKTAVALSGSLYTASAGRQERTCIIR